MMIPLTYGDEIVAAVPLRGDILVFTKFGKCYLVIVDDTTKQFLVRSL